ncbi:MAG TPA: hypothetical protein PKD86_16725 [Gemmatales bacterium]|nr:hypothetical protein [Gemmatales bacterium]HMP60990.1 hypothetical protein [Gemmatales bacterium]
MNLPATPGRSQPDGRLLVNKLTVADARHMLRAEGVLTRTELAIHLLVTVSVAALMARAIVAGEATAWHLLLPMLAQYFGLMAALPPLYWFDPHPGLRKDAMDAVRLWVLVAVGLPITFAVRAHLAGVSWFTQADHDCRLAWDWVVSAEMHWPMLAAFAGMAAGMPSRVRHLHEYGPPFVGVGIGCGMRLFALFVGLCLLPFVMNAPWQLAWSLWGLFVVADVAALVMHWDVQERLRKLDLADALNRAKANSV